MYLRYSVWYHVGVTVNEKNYGIIHFDLLD